MLLVALNITRWSNLLKLMPYPLLENIHYFVLVVNTYPWSPSLLHPAHFDSIGANTALDQFYDNLFQKHYKVGWYSLKKTLVGEDWKRERMRSGRLNDSVQKGGWKQGKKLMLVNRKKSQDMVDGRKKVVWWCESQCSSQRSMTMVHLIASLDLTTALMSCKLKRSHFISWL